VSAQPALSIIVPVLDEAENLARLLPHLRERCPGAEVIVVDGGSVDGTARMAPVWPDVRYLASDRGRARQMNAGARAARGDVLLFLHADTLLPPGAPDAIAQALADPAVVGGRFDVSFASPRLAFRVIAACMNRRSRWSGIATGDQAIFVRRGVFEALGGYPDIPLMEDVELSARLRRRGRIGCLGSRVITSARKWEREGIVRTVLLMWALRLLYFCRVGPARLHRWYYRPRTAPPLAMSRARRARELTRRRICGPGGC
jgi:rSAM/selenodomain-associated transferase 2